MPYQLKESVGQEISEVSFVCFMHHFTCWTLFISRAWSIEYDFRQWRFRLATECWLSSVGKVLAWRSGGPGFQPHWGQFLTKFILICVTLNRFCHIIWQKRLSWKTQLSWCKWKKLVHCKRISRNLVELSRIKMQHAFFEFHLSGRK